jgi:hypothetical protein
MSSMSLPPRTAAARARATRQLSGVGRDAEDRFQVSDIVSLRYLTTASRRTHWGKSRSFRGKTFLWLFLGCQRWNTVGMSERLSIAMFNTGYSRLTMREKESESKRESDVVTLGNAMIDIYLCAFSRIPPRCSLAPQTNQHARKHSFSALLSGARSTHT